MVEKTGLIVLVYGGDTGDALPGVRVMVDGRPMETGENGLARFIPCEAGEHTVSAVRPEGMPELVAPDDERVEVEPGQCPICALHMPRGVTPSIRILWAHDDHAVAGVELELKKSGAPKCTTTELGTATWAQHVRPYSYDVQAVFPDGAPYLLFDGAVAVNSVDLLLRPAHTLKIKRSPVTFRVQQQVGGAVEELVDARVKLRDLAQDAATALEVGQALAKFVIPVVKVEQQKTCEVESLTPDASDAVYEVVEVTSA
ncbi:hypothetical protein ACLESD_09585 [Pyxidicoccus sp. 3LFB2]